MEKVRQRRGNGAILLGLVGFLCVFLTCAFVVLKLTGLVLWPWLWVLAPIWLLWATLITAFFIVGFYHLFLRPGGG